MEGVNIRCEGYRRGGGEMQFKSSYPSADGKNIGPRKYIRT